MSYYRHKYERSPGTFMEMRLFQRHLSVDFLSVTFISVIEDIKCDQFLMICKAF